MLAIGGEKLSIRNWKPNAELRGSLHDLLQDPRVDAHRPLPPVSGAAVLQNLLGRLLTMEEARFRLEREVAVLKGAGGS